MPIRVKQITPEEIQPFPSDNQGLNADEVTQVINRFWEPQEIEGRIGTHRVCKVTITWKIGDVEIPTSILLKGPEYKGIWMLIGDVPDGTNLWQDTGWYPSNWNLIFTTSYRLIPAAIRNSGIKPDITQIVFQNSTLFYNSSQSAGFESGMPYNVMGDKMTGKGARTWRKDNWIEFSYTDDDQDSSASVWDRWLKEDYIRTLQNPTHFIINWNENFFAWSGDSTNYPNPYPPRAIL